MVLLMSQRGAVERRTASSETYQIGASWVSSLQGCRVLSHEAEEQGEGPAASMQGRASWFAVLSVYLHAAGLTKEDCQASG